MDLLLSNRPIWRLCVSAIMAPIRSTGSDFSGLDTDHVVYSIETVVKSADGQEVSCRLVWEGTAKPAGVCRIRLGLHFRCNLSN